MANCRNCSAPLAAGSVVCCYCGTRNDVDLKGIHEYTVAVPRSQRTCPRCIEPLQTIDLSAGGTFLIERCEKCLGLFFDPGELEALLEKSVSHVYAVDHKTLAMLQEAKRHDDYGVVYVPCPVCGKFMNRVNFGARSGVVVDRCGDHGVWLDAGELRQLMEWTKAGGQMLHQQVMERRREEEKRRQERLERERAQRRGCDSDSSGVLGSGAFGGRSSGHGEPDLLGLLAQVAGWLRT